MTEAKVIQINAEELDQYVKRLWCEYDRRSNGLSLIIDGTQVEVMTSCEVEAATGLSYITLWRYAKLPKDHPKYLAPIRHNGRNYYKRKDVERYLRV